MDTKKLRQKILDLAIRGKLVPQDPNDEPASVLLERIRAEKEHLIKEGKIKRSKKSASDDEIEAPFEIPESWEWVRLDELCDIKGGKRIPRGMDFSKVPTEHVYLRVTNMKSHTIVENEIKYIDEEVFQIIKNYTISSNDLYLTIAGTIGDVGVIPIKFSNMNLTENAAKLTNLHCDKQFLMYALLSTVAQNHFSSKFHQVAQPKLSIETASSAIIALPPIAEQKRIANEIERWFTVLDVLEGNEGDLLKAIDQAKSKILDLAIHGKLIPQDPNDEPAIELLKRINPKFEVCDNVQYDILPNGWTCCRLEEIVDYEQPQAYIVQSTNYNPQYTTPVLTAGKSFIIGYTNEEEGICSNLPVIIFDDFTTDSRYVDFPFKVKSSAMKILHVKEGVNIQYVCHFMSVTRLIGDTHKRYWISEYSKLAIPLPPYQEQLRIVAKIEELFAVLDSIKVSLE